MSAKQIMFFLSNSILLGVLRKPQFVTALHFFSYDDLLEDDYFGDAFLEDDEDEDDDEDDTDQNWFDNEDEWDNY